ncbi:MAG: 2-isopropylmalate synthase [Dehalococcoidia bacterium]|nr:2-isopropylmalate synthase [Chloroflexi bacterium CFX7]MCK6565579.1 2-isopropylmalate synthase [Dehalococcoidia bacterium]NUQ54838.1 2-isopropylmalate synthase [Dehalococcoidia bacterium]RIL01483.1 MAG: 2-isopropylmalate synthase [bacterium]
MAEKIYIFDTTLRDGEQSAGVAFTPREKVEIAKQLEKLGVDIIEAGFPCSTPGDLEAVAGVAKEVRGATICALARAVPADIDTAWEAVKNAADPRIHVFINTSDIQMAHQLHKDREQVLTQAEAMVRHAAKYTSNVEFSPMDATRADPHFVYAIVQRCIDAGATTINIPDSVGYAIPEELGGLFRSIFENVPNIHKARVSFHGQNDLGLCTANTLTAIQNGARQVEVTINGIGERAGNTSLEEVVMALKTRKDFFGFQCDINTREIYRASKLVEKYSGMPVQWNKAIVGKNAFRHGSGIHQDGILKLRETWEIMDPAEIGIPQGTQLVLGKLSGRHAFKIHMEELGYELTDEELNRAFAAFKELADKKMDVDDRDLEAIVNDNLRDMAEAAWRMDMVQVSAGDHATPTATLRLIDPQGNVRIDAATGTGPVDAVYRAMNRITGLTPELTEFSVKSVTEGIDAQGEVTIRIEQDGKTYTGRAADTDIIVASARAYMSALNRMVTAAKVATARG